MIPFMDDMLKLATASSKNIRNLVSRTSPLGKAKNIKQLARKNTIVFPVILTNSLTEETTILLLKALEREYIAYLQVILSQNNIITTDHGDFSPAKRLGLTENFFLENWKLIKDVGHESIYEEFNMDILNGMTLKLNLLDEAISADDIWNATINYLKQNNNVPLNDADKRRIRDLKDEMREYVERLHQLDTDRDNILRGNGNLNRLNRLDKLAKRLDKRIQILDTKIKSIYNKGKVKTRTVRQGTSIKNNKISKYTELEPTLLSVEVVYNNPDGGIASTNHVYAVKTHPHITTRDEMNINIDNAIKKKSVLLNFVKWVSGEISLFKDIILAIDDNKKAVKNLQNSKNSFIWDELFDGHNVNIIRTSIKTPKKLPLTTLVMSIEDYYDLKESYGIDLFKRRYVEDLYSKLLIANLIIVDENNGEYFQYDRDAHDYLTFNLDYVKKEGDKDGNIVKSILDFTNRR